MPSPYDQDLAEPELSLAESINLATRRMATAVAVAGMAIGLGLWAKPSPPRYQGFVTTDGVVRLNTRSGSIVICRTGQKCRLVLLESKDLEGRHSFGFDFFDKPETVPPPASPAPALRPPAPAAPAPAAPPRAKQ
jgi:hypothetical protein